MSETKNYNEWRGLQIIVMLHGLYAIGESPGVKANLREANLSGVDLSGADLRWAIIEGADLSWANLSEAYLEGAILGKANLTGANLGESNLRRAELRGADLSGANLEGCTIVKADLEEANLQGTCLDPAAMIPELDLEEARADGFEIVDRDGRTAIRGWRTEMSGWCGHNDYRKPGWHETPVFSVSIETPCHPGIYLAGKQWLAQCPYTQGEPLVRCWAYADEVVKAGDKYRAKRIYSEGAE